MTSPSESANHWAKQASRLPLAFAQVREDPRLDLEVISQLPDHPIVVMIASGGETAIQIGRQRPAQLHLIDMNPAQLAITRLKWHLAQRSSVSEARSLLGHSVMDPCQRSAELRKILAELELAPGLLGPLDQVARWGPDFSGRYERTFAELRRELSIIAPEIQQLLESSKPCGPAALPLDPSTQSGRIFDAAFETVMSLANLVCLFGTDATQNPRQSFAAHFATRTRQSLARADRVRNPYLWQLLAGCFPSGAPYDWLVPEASNASLRTVAPAFHCGSMLDVLRSFPPASVDMIHLSNILDWLSPIQAAEMLHGAHRVLKPGGRVIVRQLNSTLRILELDCRLSWDLERGQRMVRQDRSFFYPDIFVGVRE